MQIAAGKLKGKKLSYPARGLRPTTDKIRSALFNIIEANFPDLLKSANVCDIFAGAGAVGIEALSRGAASVTFIDNDRITLRYLTKNVQGYEDQVNMIGLDAVKAMQRIKTEKFDLIFLDPPYNMNLVAPVVEKIAEYDMLTLNGIAVVEHHKKESISIPDKLELYKEKKYSETVITILVKRR
jgi:16S rRNA (guanine(966)-N(2))-methyltransferase RsmD